MKNQQNTTATVVSALTARTQLGQILKRVQFSKERFLIGRNGQPQAVVMGIDDFMDVVAPAPKWLENSWRASEKNGTDKMTMREIDAEIKASRRARAKQAKTR